MQRIVTYQLGVEVEDSIPDNLTSRASTEEEQDKGILAILTDSSGVEYELIFDTKESQDWADDLGRYLRMGGTGSEYRFSRGERPKRSLKIIRRISCA